MECTQISWRLQRLIGTGVPWAGGGDAMMDDGAWMDV